MTDVSAPTEPGRSPARPEAAADLADGIGRRVAAYRARREMRVADLAREIAVSPSLISQIERGQSRPSVSTLFALAQALDVPVDAFFREWADGMAPAPAAPASFTAPASPAASKSPAGLMPPADPAATANSAATATPRGTTAPSAPAATTVRSTGGARSADDSAQAYEADAHGDAGESRYVVRHDERAAIDIEGGVRWERLTPRTLPHLDFLQLVYGPRAESHRALYTHPGTEMVLVTRGILDIFIGFERYRLHPGDSMHLPSTTPHRYVNPTDETTRAVTVILNDCPAPVDPSGVPQPREFRSRP